MSNSRLRYSFSSLPSPLKSVRELSRTPPGFALDCQIHAIGRQPSDPTANFSARDPLQPAHVRPQSLRDQHRAVGLLIILQNRQPGPAHGQPAAVEGVHKFVLRLRARPACSGYWPAAPGTTRNWSRTKSRGRAAAPEATLPGQTSSPTRSPVSPAAQQNPPIGKSSASRISSASRVSRSCSASESSGRVNFTSSTF